MLHPESTSRACARYLHGSAPGGGVGEGNCISRAAFVRLHLCFSSRSSQEAGPAPESTLEEVGMAEMAAMRKQVRRG